MSASSKKKLRKEQEAAKLTEKQLTEQKEAKKLKTYSTIFVVVIALMVVFAAYTAISNTISHSGIFERNTNSNFVCHAGQMFLISSGSTIT